jgi:hypothetical protein
VQTLSAQIGWSHHQVLLDAWAEEPKLYLWYAAKAAENRWSVRQLQGQIALGLHERQGAAVTNFAAALEPADADQALQATKDPYVFDFLGRDRPELRHRSARHRPVPLADRAVDGDRGKRSAGCRFWVAAEVRLRRLELPRFRRHLNASGRKPRVTHVNAGLASPGRGEEIGTRGGTALRPGRL